MSFSSIHSYLCLHLQPLQQNKSQTQKNSHNYKNTIQQMAIEDLSFIEFWQSFCLCVCACIFVLQNIGFCFVCLCMSIFQLFGCQFFQCKRHWNCKDERQHTRNTNTHNVGIWHKHQWHFQRWNCQRHRNDWRQRHLRKRNVSFYPQGLGIFNPSGFKWVFFAWIALHGRWLTHWNSLIVLSFFLVMFCCFIAFTLIFLSLWKTVQNHIQWVVSSQSRSNKQTKHQ